MRSRALEIGGLVEQQIQRALHALVTGDLMSDACSITNSLEILFAAKAL